MGRILILGRAGSGKTRACLDRLADAADKKRSALLLVPTYGQAEHLRFGLLERLGGLFQNYVETFSSLSEHLTGLTLRELATPAQCDRVAEATLFPDFPEAAPRPGFRAEFLALVKEIKEQGTHPETVLAEVRLHFADGGRELGLFAAYERYLAGLTRPDHADFLRSARDRLRDKTGCDWRRDLLLVDGFHDFTGLERQIIEELEDRCAETVVTLPGDPEDAGHVVFTAADRTRRSFHGYRVETLRQNHRAGGALAHLEKRLFLEDAGKVDAPEIAVLSVPTEEDEADRLARRIASSPRSFREFLIVRRSFDGLHATYRAAFSRHGIPLRFFAPEPLGKIPVARAVTLFLRHIVHTLDLRDLLALLRSPFLLDHPPPEEMDELAQHLREKAEPPDLDDFPRVREALAPPPPDANLGFALRKRFGMRDALQANPSGDEDLARASRFLKLLEAEAAAVEGLDLETAAQRVLERIPLFRGAPPDRRHDCVYAVEALHARQWEKPVVFVAGLNADSFPRQSRQDLFLRDDVRTALAEERDFHLPLRGRKEEEERYLFYVALTRAREELCLSWVSHDEQGTPRAPSPYLDHALRHVEPKRRVIPISELFAAAEDAVSARDLLPLVADGLGRADIAEGALAAALYDRDAIDRDMLSWPRRLELARRRAITDLPKELKHLSPSSIGDYHRCPYLFFARRVLGVQPKREPSLDPLVRGSLVHDVLEHVAKHADEDPGEIFDKKFAEVTEHLRLELGDEAWRRSMRASVLVAAEEIRAAPVKEVERMFEIPVGDVTLRGRIDRVDSYPAGDVVRDYKTGRIHFDDVVDGNVQLDAYLLAVDRPAGATFERLREGDSVGFVTDGVSEIPPKKNRIFKVSEDELARRMANVRDVIDTVAKATSEGRFAVNPADPDFCPKCDAYDLCRTVPAYWLERRARAERDARRDERDDAPGATGDGA
ncbi:MAG: PD-(D/E)XK nuclease family protein [Planctomycetota bacterium]